LPELLLIEGNQQFATKHDESLSPSLFTFRSHFCRHSPPLVLRFYDGTRLPWTQEAPGSNPGTRPKYLLFQTLSRTAVHLNGIGGKQADRSAGVASGSA
jgi:hypothetical protein